MNPRLNRAGVRRRALHANVPARPGQDDGGDDEVQALRRHVNVHDTGGRWLVQGWGWLANRLHRPGGGDAISEGSSASASAAKRWTIH